MGLAGPRAYPSCAQTFRRASVRRRASPRTSRCAGGARGKQIGRALRGGVRGCGSHLPSSSSKAAGRRRKKGQIASSASCAEASAASRCPSSLCLLPRLLRLTARSGRNASGRDSASLRRRSTASCVGRERRLALPERALKDAQVVEAHGEVGQERLRTRLRQLAVEVDRLLGGGERRLALPQRALPVAQVVEARGEVGQERLRPRLRQLAVEVDRLLRGSERRLALPERALHVAQVVEAHGEVGQERLRTRLPRACGGGRPPPAWKRAPPRVARARSACCPGC